MKRLFSALIRFTGPFTGPFGVRYLRLTALPSENLNQPRFELADGVATEAGDINYTVRSNVVWDSSRPLRLIHPSIVAYFSIRVDVCPEIRMTGLVATVDIRFCFTQAFTWSKANLLVSCSPDGALSFEEKSNQEILGAEGMYLSLRTAL